MLEASKEDSPPIREPTNTSDVPDLLASFQKMRTEERELLETKEDLLAKERDLQSKLVEEIGKKKIAIDVLKSEVQNLENRCKEMSQALGSPSTGNSSATGPSY
jgi:predicted transcriptional regulator